MKTDIHQLTRYKIQEAITYDITNRHLGYKSCKESLGLLRSACGFFDVPIPPTKKFKLPEPKIDTSELEDFDCVLDVICKCDANVRLAALLSLSCGGLRASEVRGIQFNDVLTDTDGIHYIFIRRSKVKVNRQNIIRNRNKTKKSTRKILLPDYLFHEIKEIKHDQETDFVIPLTYDQLAGRFRRKMKKYNINLTFHGLRKLFATETTEMGIPKEMIQKAGGWSDSKVLDQVYIKIRERDLIMGMEPYTKRIQSVLEKYKQSDNNDNNLKKPTVP